MTTFANTLRTDLPSAAGDPTETPTFIKDKAKAYQQRLDVDHYFEASASSTYDDADTGYHRKVTFQGPISSPTVPANQGVLHLLDVDSKAELHWVDEDDNVKQMTSAGALLLASAEIVGVLANNTYFTAVDAAGTGTVSLIKANSSDSAVLPDAVETATNAAPTTDVMVANKKYVDDRLIASGTTIYNTTIGGSGIWEDLDASAVVPSGGLLFLQLTAGSSVSSAWAIKPKGEGSSTASLHFNEAGHDMGTSSFHPAEVGEVCYMFMATDTSGIMEIASQHASKDMAVKVLWSMPY